MTPTEKLYKVIRNKQADGWTKEEFMATIRQGKKCAAAIFADNVWEVVAVSSFDKKKKHGEL